MAKTRFKTTNKQSGPVPFRFNTNVKPIKPAMRFAGPVAYPLPEGVRRQKSDLPYIFHFTSPRSLGHSIPPKTTGIAGATEPDIFVIHGIQVGSKNEWYLYEALLQSGIPDSSIGYQVPWHGGRVIGGQVLDFVLDIGGTQTVLRMMGHYWHPTAYGTPLDVYTKSQFEGEGYVVYDIPDYQATNISDAASTLARLRVV
jgi:hypothetical protein